MEIGFQDYLISDDKSLLDVDTVCQFLSRSYWASARSRETIELSIGNSMCVGVYHRGRQVGFARVVTDYSTMYWLCDVYIDEGHRGKGLGKKLTEFITDSPQLKCLMGILGTRNAHGLYEKSGFVRDTGALMRRMPRA